MLLVQRKKIITCYDFVTSIVFTFNEKSKTRLNFYKQTRKSQELKIKQSAQNAQNVHRHERHEQHEQMLKMFKMLKNMSNMSIMSNNIFLII